MNENMKGKWCWCFCLNLYAAAYTAPFWIFPFESLTNSVYAKNTEDDLLYTILFKVSDEEFELELRGD